MKRPLAAASLLATWYLMTPPWAQIGKMNTQASLSTWGTISYYDSAAACETDRQTMIKATGAGAESAKLLSAAQCVAGTDPRLK
jgi:hypothetical protein